MLLGRRLILLHNFSRFLQSIQRLEKDEDSYASNNSSNRLHMSTHKLQWSSRGVSEELEITIGDVQ